ncbi:MAG: phosphoenolpyruvate--protein phosphotransferase [Clostridiales bacterium]|uniref:phosphoenolpyruvate--protein phosphotransferase n=1 Tax=Clostridium sp. N3C TaxID=1776758 RepID=UPI00092E122C|nr:phosphoenolpyruvate--protein phosphotransferase [Clostridium sp. N3C]NLZ49933.1 phosphoenolpyruvate--protein phosphotransferase [Clostridiales bacterium]SCN22583.1 Phosphoenolpyruvate-protein phosphotransferase [Clostridium sp. N3C]
MIKGISASWGYAIGTVFIKEEPKLNLDTKYALNLEYEKEKLLNAINLSKEQIRELREKVAKEIGEDEAQVFDSHYILLEDPDFLDAVQKEMVGHGKSAENAVNDVINSYIDTMSMLEDEYLKERVSDIKDVGRRLIMNITGNVSKSFANIKENTVIVARDLTPSDTAQLDKENVIAFLTEVGGLTSHTAIMARAMEIPAVVGLNDIVYKLRNGDKVVVDGVEGVVIVNPEEKVIESYREKIKEFEIGKRKLKELKNKVIIDSKGKHIEISANIGSTEEMDKVLEYGADGIGLFRTEFLYMDREFMPSEEEQFEAYKKVLIKMENKPVVIRTLDVGGDKSLPYLKTPEEMNPFLGYRAIRLCLDRKDLFKTQLRALLRASIYGNLKIMFPMISTPDEFIKAKEVLTECMDELKQQGIEFKENIPLGIMIEVPSAAVRADEFAKMVDFFSIGTNDLIQYTLAVDRTNEKISHLYNTMDLAVLRLIKFTIDAAHKEGKCCGMCGEMAADERAIPLLLEYGLDEFSMNPASILRTKQIILDHINLMK